MADRITGSKSYTKIWLVLKCFLERLQLTFPENGRAPIFLYSCHKWVTNASVFADLTREKSYLILNCMFSFENVADHLFMNLATHFL